MSRGVRLLSLSIVLAVSAQAEAAEWDLQSQAGRGAVLTYGLGQPVSYRFECAGTQVVVTQTGVTKLMDLTSESPVGDDSGAVMPKGAAVMALFGGKGDPQFVPAEATKNPAGGWDLTIRLSRNDKQLKAIRKSEMISLFTTGYTMAVAMDAAAHAKWDDFMERCKAS